METANKTTNTVLSDAQRRFMDEVDVTGESRPPWGYPSAGRDASNWHRTARSLQNKGLVKVLRSGHGHRAVRS